MVENNMVMKQFLETLKKIISKKTSDAYAVELLKEVIEEKKNYYFLSKINYDNGFNVSVEIDEEKKKYVGEAINAITLRIINSLSISQEDFIKELEGYLGSEFISELVAYGVMFYPYKEDTKDSAN